MARSTTSQRAQLIPQIGPILKLIRSKEARGYNDVVGHLRKRKTSDITTWRLRDVRAWQTRWDPTTKNGEAVGWYQFTKETIDTIVGSSDISWDDYFTGEVQDHMATDLLIRRTSIISFVQGKSTPEELALDLAKIWASFPVPWNLKDWKGRPLRKNESYYKHLGNNKAGVKVRSVVAVLNKNREQVVARGSFNAPVTISSRDKAPPPTAPVRSTRPTQPKRREQKIDVTVSKTKATVMRYQRWLNFHGARPALRVDGILGNNTRKAANSVGRDAMGDLNALLKGNALMAPVTGNIYAVRALLPKLRNPVDTVRAYQTILNTKLSRNAQIGVDGLYGPKTHQVALSQSRPILADLKNLSVGKGI